LAYSGGLVLLGFDVFGLIFPLLQMAGVRLALNTGPRWYPSLLLGAVVSDAPSLAV
jgi:hypothetical protein